MAAAIAVAIISSIERMDSARTALSHAGMEASAIHKSKYTHVKVTATINNLQSILVHAVCPENVIHVFQRP